MSAGPVSLRSTNALLDVRDLRMTLRTDDGPAQVLDRVSLSVRSGEIHGLVGESGCGKSTLVRAILGIYPRTATIESGQILFDGTDLLR
ncbi:MAG: ATP-binding cassette domain-containing protein, partial [Kiloniellaceae bacterium]|nr:ATP-binding cassette domain-containing protein [Kiloniellaceae bacterium]